MTFDELIGAEPTGAERDRLRDVHDLLMQAGPPPEISPALAAGPTLAMTLSRLGRISSRRRRYALTAVAAALLALVIGLGATMHGHGLRYPTIALRGISIGTGASGRLELLPSKGTTQRMRLEVKGLPSLGKRRYVVYLVRNRVRVASCGSFTVPKGSGKVTVTTLVSPYRYVGTDTWVVAVQSRAGTGQTVLQPVA